MKYCIECGKEISENETLCQDCLKSKENNNNSTKKENPKPKSSTKHYVLIKIIGFYVCFFNIIYFFGNVFGDEGGAWREHYILGIILGFLMIGISDIIIFLEKIEKIVI